MADHRFWVGPLGSLRALPDVAAEVKVPVTRIGGMHRSLAGGLTVDTFARKRAWTWSYETLLSTQLAYLEALQYGNIPGPLRLIDPHRFNRLPEDAASGGSVTRSNAAFFTDAGSFSYYQPLTDVTTADLATLGPSALLRGCQEWLISAPAAAVGGNVTYPSNTTYTGQAVPSDRWQTPVLPGETVEVSMWVLGPASTQVAAKVVWLNRNGQSLGSSFDSPVQALTTLDLSTWTKFSGTVTAPAGAAAVTPDLNTDTAHCPAGTSIFHTGWQVGVPNPALEPAGRYTYHCEPEDVSGGWHIGGGAPYVVPDVGEVGYAPTVLGFTSAGLTLYET